MARNRKRAKERRARRPQAVGTARHELDEGAPSPIRHATPDAELAEAQLAVGRPELAAEGEPEPDDLELDADGDGGDGAGGANGAGFGGGTLAPSGGGELAASGAATPAARRRPGNRLITFLQGSWRELQRVQWPDRRQVMQATGVVIGFVIVAGVFLGVADTLASKLMNYILNQ